MSTHEAQDAPKRPWLAVFFAITLALASSASGSLWFLARLMEESTSVAFGHALAPLTMFFLDHRSAVLLLPLPWLAVAIYALARGRMSTQHLVLFSSTLILALGATSLIMAIGFVAPWLPHVKRDVPNAVFGSPATLITFLGASEITAQRLHYRRSSAQNAWRLDSYDRDASVSLTGLQASTFQQLLAQESTYGWPFGTSCAPNYGVLLTARSGEATVRVALCFECSILGVYDSADDGAKPVNRERDFRPPARQMLVALVQQLFPADDNIQSLE